MAKKKIGIDALFQPSVPAGIPVSAATAVAETASKGEYQDMPVDRLSPRPDQPRRYFNQAAMEQLTASVRAQGVLQPLLVRAAGEGRDGYEIVAGERRWRA